MKVAAHFHYLFLFLLLSFSNEIKATYPTCEEAGNNLFELSLNGYSGVLPFDIKDGLEIGDEVRNDVAIYFDHNSPIITNEVVNVLSTHFFDIECNVHTMENEAAENTAVSITGDLELDMTIDPSGSIMLENLSAGGNYNFDFEKEEEIALGIYNSFGQRERVISQNKKYPKGISQNKINLEGLSSGTYFIYLKTKETFLVKRFVKL